MWVLVCWLFLAIFLSGLLLSKLELIAFFGNWFVVVSDLELLGLKVKISLFLLWIGLGVRSLTLLKVGKVMV